VKNRGVAGIGGIAPVDFAGADDTDWGLRLFHRANLYRRGVSAEEQTFAQGFRFLIGDDERVLRVTRGVVRGKLSASKL